MNQEKDNAFNFPEVCIVEASAGSGKTYALAKRYIALLINLCLNNEEILLRKILAITFTNKATIEMKERILELLKKIALDAFLNKEEEKDISDMLKVDKLTAQKQAQRVMDELIKHYSSFQVQTIDSFINTLLLGSAANIGRSASFKIKKDYAQCLAYCIDLVIDQALTNQDVFNLLEDFLQHYLFVDGKGGWFPKEDISGLMQFLFRLSNKYGRFFQIYKGESIDVIKKKKECYRQIQELSLQFPQGLNGNAKKSISVFVERNDYTFSISDLPGVFGSGEVPMNKEEIASLDFSEKWEDVSRKLKQLIELDATVAYNTYVRLFWELLNFFQIVSKKEDTLFLEELNRKARLLFDREGVTVAEIYYRLAAKFSHFLIDEFQDTSILQWHNLEMMVEEALSCGGSLFYVGDKKQAIYRFRGGEVRLFDDVKDKFSHFNIKNTHLTKNWRSQKTIVEFNNRIFSRDNLMLMLKSSGIEEELNSNERLTEEVVQIFKDAVQQYKEENADGYVCVRQIEDKKQLKRNDIVQSEVISLIEKLKSCFQYEYEDIAILARDNKEIELITSWLLEAGIPVESEKTLNVIEHPLIKEVLSFLKFLYSPIDDLNFASFILGEIFSRVTAISQQDMRDFIFLLRKEKKMNKDVFLYRLFRSFYPEVWNNYIDEFFKSVGFLSPYELVISIYQRFKVLEYFKENQAFFMKFLELIKVKEDEYVGLGRFLEYLKHAAVEDLYVNVTHSGSVKTLTIHKSKGLEFPIVIIPFLRIDINPETGKGTNSYVIEAENSQLGLVRITKNHCVYSQKLRQIYVQNYKKACIDELNNIYVALTRARHQLYVFIPEKTGRSINKARFLIPEEIKEMGAEKSYAKKEKDRQLLINLPPSAYKNWIKELKDEFGGIEPIKNREKIRYGNMFHFMFSCLNGLSKQNKESLVNEAFKKCAGIYPKEEGLEFVKDKVKMLLNQKELEPFFYASDGKLYREKEVVNVFGDTKRIDCLIVKEKEVWIIDYKSSAELKEEYQKQVKEYISIIEGVYSDKKARGFILYIDEAKVEEVK